MPPDPSSLFASIRVVPVVTIARAADAVPLARALVAGGLPLIEVTLRTECALAAVRVIAAEVPDAVVGLGTLTREADIEPAVRAGARFLVSPGTSARLAAALAQAPVPSLPGCASVTEAMALDEHGFKLMKFFPAEVSGGIAWLKAVAAPLPDIRFCPTGGIDKDKAAAYLALPNVAAVGGTWVAPQEAIGAGDFARITGLARYAARLSG